MSEKGTESKAFNLAYPMSSKVRKALCKSASTLLICIYCAFEHTYLCMYVKIPILHFCTHEQH